MRKFLSFLLKKINCVLCSLISVLVVTQTHIYIHNFFMVQYDVAKKGRQKSSIYAKIFSCVREVMM